MNDQELVEKLSSYYNDVEIYTGTCSYTLRNGTPAGWQVTIIAAGINFYYKDGTSETLGPFTLNLNSGAEYTFRSSKPNGCVTRIFLAATVISQSEPQPKNFTHNITTKPSQECIYNDGGILAPQTKLQENETDIDKKLSITSIEV